MSKVNLKQLTLDIERNRKQRLQGDGRGRRVTGSMQIIRDNLAEIEGLHRSGATWVDIAAGLAAQGVMQGDGQPITSKRLTSLIASIRRQDDTRRAKATARAARPDLMKRQPDRALTSMRIGLSAELQTTLQMPASAADDDTEETIRRRQYEATKSVLKTRK